VKKKTAPPDSAAKPKKAKVDSLKYSPRQYMLGERIIMRGDSGRDVRSLANILVKKLYMDERDIIYTAGGGVLYDGELVKAVKRFQRLNGFHEDGIVGHGLIKALRKRSSGSK
jgi:murein L,D-transpeptidase YcbB/YkuD